MNRTITVAIILLALNSCKNHILRTEYRHDASRDLSAKWNDKDSLIVAESMKTAITKHTWLTNFIIHHERKPVIQIGNTIVDCLGEHINTAVFELEIRNALIDNSNIRVRAGLGDSLHTRTILKDQDLYASAESKQEMFNELGSDFILTGSILLQMDRAGRRKDKSYSIDMELREIQSQELVWAKRIHINKQVNRSIFN